MGATLEIRDGNPWWTSTDIWTVPGNDPSGPQGMPVASQPCYVWAHVRNTGGTSVENATVNFYWANPSVGFDRTTATSIGTSYVSLAANDETDVLCLTAWVPSYVNQGHECVLAEAFHPSLDPLPAGPAFNVPTDRHVAQRNLAVVAAAGHMFHFAFEVHNTWRVTRDFVVRARPGTVEELHSFAERLRLHSLNKGGAVSHIGFAHDPCPHGEVRSEHHELPLKLDPKARAGLCVSGRLEGQAATLHIEQLVGEAVVGGLTILVVQPGAKGGR